MIKKNDKEIIGGPNYSSWRAPKLSVSEFLNLSEFEKLKYLANCGHLAASSHNTQPWKFQLMETEKIIRVYLDLGRYYFKNSKIVDQRRVLPVSDKNGRQGCVSVGCAITNIETAAKFLGIFRSIKFMPISTRSVLPLKKPSSDSENLVHVADIILGATKPSGDKKLFEAIFTRMVNRSEYDQSKKIPDGILQEIREAKNPDVKVEILERDAFSASKLMLIANSQLQADKTVFNDSEFIDELAKWVLKNGSNKGLGMPFETFGVKNNFDALKLYLSFQLKKTFSMKDKAGFSQEAMKGIESAPIVGIISVVNDAPKSWLEAGRILGKIALISETAGLAMAVHAGIAEVGGIKQSLSWINHQKETVTIIFRIGYPRVTMPHAPRLPIEEVIF